MKLLDLLVELNPSIQQLRDSEQFKLSKQIIKKRISLDLNQQEFSTMLAIPFDKLVKLEACDLNVSVDEYKEILKFIESKVVDFILGFDIPINDFVNTTDTNSQKLVSFLKFNDSPEKLLEKINYIDNLEEKLERNIGIYTSTYEAINTRSNDYSAHVFESSFEASKSTSKLLNNSQNLRNSRANLSTNQIKYQNFRNIPVA